MVSGKDGVCPVDLALEFQGWINSGVHGGNFMGLAPEGRRGRLRSAHVPRGRAVFSQVPNPRVKGGRSRDHVLPGSVCRLREGPRRLQPTSGLMAEALFWAQQRGRGSPGAGASGLPNWVRHGVTGALPPRLAGFQAEVR